MFDTFLLDLIFDALVFGFMSWRYSLALSQFSGALHVLNWFNLLWFEKFDRLYWQGRYSTFVSTSYQLNLSFPSLTISASVTTKLENLHYDLILEVKPTVCNTNYKGDWSRQQAGVITLALQGWTAVFTAVRFSWYLLISSHKLEHFSGDKQDQHLHWYQPDKLF